MSDLQIRFGKMVRSLRTERKMTQDDLADKSGLTKDMITKLERGLSGASFESIGKLATAFDADPAALFSAEAQLRKARSKTRQRISEMLTVLHEDDLKWIETLLLAALKPRRREAPLDKSRVQQRVRR
jgi:transcriptional regulator with XRE-family HTH domain